MPVVQGPTCTSVDPTFLDSVSLSAPRDPVRRYSRVPTRRWGGRRSQVVPEVRGGHFSSVLPSPPLPSLSFTSLPVPSPPVISRPSPPDMGPSRLLNVRGCHPRGHSYFLETPGCHNPRDTRRNLPSTKVDTTTPSPVSFRSCHPSSTWTDSSVTSPVPEATGGPGEG